MTTDKKHNIAIIVLVLAIIFIWLTPYLAKKGSDDSMSDMDGMSDMNHVDHGGVPMAASSTIDYGDVNTY